MSDASSPEHLWCLINMDWFVQWQSSQSSCGFGDGILAASQRGDKAPEIHPIDNQSLLDFTGVPRKRLVCEVDYAAVSVKLWNSFVSAYGGGPLILRLTKNIYDPPVSDLFPYLCRFLKPFPHGISCRLAAALDLSRPAMDKWFVDQRVFEGCYVLSHDRRHQEHGKPWFILDACWLRQWRAFINHSGDRPGPIENTRLLDSSGRVLSGLLKVSDYRAVCQEVWLFLRSQYGGGPALPRASIDLYDPTPTGYGWTRRRIAFLIRSKTSTAILSRIPKPLFRTVMEYL
eukprot:GILK01013276.1.p1 GENE.GILK01013276.1~~GILK01013276.1.p1  ORF type:complete len:320 (-),score=27.36 GILK01013276.1:490-1350(-)